MKRFGKQSKDSPYCDRFNTEVILTFMEFIMSVYEKIDAMSKRLSQDERRHISNRIRLYSEGVKAKIKNAEYALVKIKELSPQSNNITSSDSQDFCVKDKIHFYVDSFFAFLYSVFDVVSHVTNHKYRLRQKEKNVSFDKIKKKLNQNHAGEDIQQIYDGLARKPFFIQLDKYRNCSTHRRQIFIETLTRSVTPGYTTSGEILEVYRLLCDDPLSLNPKTKKGRTLVDYCQDMMERVKSTVIEISEKI